jgi:hypothetical protein
MRQRAFEHPAGELLHQPGGLGDAQELGRGQHPPLRVVPADERLEADHPPPGDV